MTPLPPPPPSAVKAAYKSLALTHHPDKGGSAEAFARITQARDDLLSSAEPHSCVHWYNSAVAPLYVRGGGVWGRLGRLVRVAAVTDDAVSRFYVAFFCVAAAAALAFIARRRRRAKELEELYSPGYVDEDGGVGGLRAAA
eukprot:CAMPEP_0182474628 /NCGR_PEP_ID=MMETSP1319-20130603/26014_1 /TAXON_ID=172717 /ORGANISM="Bolidomonas pacifica, Strain RCC208" /LENGTH=140 /DNA_ID=CAMNT_0024675545 /DNA_START=247 /DNA_END=673 /DNA_ORIENTATION=+